MKFYTQCRLILAFKRVIQYEYTITEYSKYMQLINKEERRGKLQDSADVSNTSFSHMALH